MSSHRNHASAGPSTDLKGFGAGAAAYSVPRRAYVDRARVPPPNKFHSNAPNQPTKNFTNHPPNSSNPFKSTQYDRLQERKIAHEQLNGDELDGSSILRGLLNFPHEQDQQRRSDFGGSARDNGQGAYQGQQQQASCSSMPVSMSVTSVCQTQNPKHSQDQYRDYPEPAHGHAPLRYVPADAGLTDFSWTVKHEDQASSTRTCVPPHAATLAGPVVHSTRRNTPLTTNSNCSGGKQRTSMTSIMGSPIDKWFRAKFADSEVKAFRLFCAEYEAIRKEPRCRRMPPFLRPTRGSGSSRTIQAKELSVKAHFVDGFTKNRYIATEGPNRSSVYDFWELVYQSKADAIVMLNQPYEERMHPEVYDRSRETIQYWPMKPGTEMRYTPWIITCVSSQLKASHSDTSKYSDQDQRYAYRLTRLKLRESNPILESEPRTLIHMCHYRWPDGQIPVPSADPAANNDFKAGAQVLLDMMHQELANARGPVVVHCHAGVGRTGVCIALEASVARAVTRRTVDVKATVRLLREQRPRSVMNRWQYSIINLGLAAFLKSQKLLPAVVDVNGEEYTSDELIDDCWQDLTKDFNNTWAEDDLCDMCLPDEEEYDKLQAAVDSGTAEAQNDLTVPCHSETGQDAFREETETDLDTMVDDKQATDWMVNGLRRVHTDSVLSAEPSLLVKMMSFAPMSKATATNSTTTSAAAAACALPQNDASGSLDDQAVEDSPPPPPQVKHWNGKPIQNPREPGRKLARSKRNSKKKAMEKASEANSADTNEDVGAYSCWDT